MSTTIPAIKLLFWYHGRQLKDTDVSVSVFVTIFQLMPGILYYY